MSRSKLTAPSTPAMPKSFQPPVKAEDKTAITAKSKGKAAKAKEAEEALEYHRMVGPDPRDPRCEGAPCWGHHTPQAPGRGSGSGSNKWAKWVVCETCKLRLQYIPKVGAPGHRRSAGPLPRDVKETIAENPSAPPADLTTQAIALRGAEKGLLSRLEEVQRQKEKLKNQPDGKDNGYQQTPPAAVKKATKREGEVAAEVQEIQDAPPADWKLVTP